MSTESVTVRQLAGSSVEILHVESLRQSFGKHSHDAVAIGVIDAGVGEFWCRGATHRVPPDTVVLIDPGEVHTGGVARGHESLTYRMAYVPVEVVYKLAPDGWWPFSTPAALAPRLAAAARRFHEAVSRYASSLECESALCELLSAAATNFGDRARDARATPRVEPSRIECVRDFLHANAAADISVRELASLVQLTPSYVSRLFRRRYGLPPHAYQLQVRLRIAKARLAAGESLSATAIALGFVDQAHFSRAFRQSFGMTPGRYQRCTARGVGSVSAQPRPLESECRPSMLAARS